MEMGFALPATETIGVWEITGRTTLGHYVPLGDIALPLEEGQEAARAQSVPERFGGVYAATMGVDLMQGVQWVAVHDAARFRQALCEARIISWYPLGSGRKATARLLSARRPPPT